MLALPCEICELGYVDVETAKECEAFCRTHDACSLEITKRQAMATPEFIEVFAQQWSIQDDVLEENLVKIIRQQRRG